jgi:nitrogen fixation protein FixH
MHLTFFNDEGTALDGISSLAVNAVSHDGEEVDILVKEFETGHYVATLDLQPGEWDFEVTGAAAEGGDFAASFGAHLD